MDESTWEKGGIGGAIAVVLATGLKLIYGRSRAATVDEKYAKLRQEVRSQIEELERKMDEKFRDARREVTMDLARMQGQLQRSEDEQHEQKLKVMRALDEMQANWQSGFRAMRTALGMVEMPPGR